MAGFNKEQWQKEWSRLENKSSQDRYHQKEVEFVCGLCDFDIFIDCGPGYVGSEAWSVKDVKPNCRIFGFEPQKDRFSMLKDDYPGVLSNKCVSNVGGQIEGFMGFKKGRSDFWLIANDDFVEKGFFKKEKVGSVKLDDFLQNYGGQVFIWADVEGAEMSILLGCLDLFKKNRISGLFLEIHEKHSPNFVKGQCPPELIKKFLRDLNFKEYIFSRSATSGDYIFINQDKL